MTTISLNNLRLALQNPGGDIQQVLTDRLWPRGIRKTALGDIVWYKHASPSTALRQSLHQGRLSPTEFEQAYRQELLTQAEVLTPLLKLMDKGDLELLTAVHDAQHAYIRILREILLETRAQTTR